MTDQTPDLTEPDNPAAYALARHIADHPVSTIQAAFRYLNAPLTVELHDSVSSAVVQSALAETAVRDRIAEALSEARRPGLGGMTEADAVAHMAAAVLAVLPAADRPAEEAYRLAVSAALRLGTDATWEAIRDRAEDLTAEVQQLTEASRRLLKQRQEMAAERFAWQERGDRAEARVRQLEAVASVDRAAVLNEAAGAIAADAALRETEGEYALAEYGYELARLIRPKELADLPAVVPAGAGEEPADETSCPGFPDGCPTLIAVVPTVGSTHGGGLRCGCYDEPKEAAGHCIVAYRSTGARVLRCPSCYPDETTFREGDLHPVTSEDLPDGGLCTKCGVDVLIPQEPRP